MKAVVLALTPLIIGYIFAPRPLQAQVIFGQSSSVEAIPFNAFFVPTTSSTSSSFSPPVGFYHYFSLPQYSAVYGRLYTDFEYTLPPGEVSYDFTILQSFQY
jgi:hypothetical protein